MHLLIPAFIVSAVIWGTVRAMRALRRRDRRWTARGFAVCILFLSAAVAAGFLMLVAAAVGDLEPPSIRIRNNSFDEVWLAVPHLEPDERSSARYQRLAPGSDAFAPRSHSSATDWQTCLAPEPGVLLRIEGWDERELYRGADGQQRAVDPLPGAVTLLASLPANRCFEARDPWLAFDGVAIVEIDDPTAGPFELVAWIAAPGLLALALGAIIDVFRHQPDRSGVD